MSLFLAQAKIILDEIDLNDPAIKKAKELLNSVTKIAGMTDLINDPKFQNIINLLTPFVVNYKVNQVIRLLNEIAKEQKSGPQFDPATGFKKYI